jgi:sugar phosphate permease
MNGDGDRPKGSGRLVEGIPPGNSSRRWVVLALCSLLFICSQFYRVSSAIIAPNLQKDLGLSSEALGFLGAAFFYAFALAQIPLGPCLDRWGARLCMTCLSLVGAGGAWVFAWAGGLTGASLGRMLLGLGMAGNLMGSMKLFTGWFSPREFATLSGTILALGTLGNMLAATPLAVMVDRLGWRWTFTFMGAATALLAVLFYALVRDAPTPVGEDARQQARIPLAERFRTLLTSREYWLISLGTFFRYGTFVAIQGLWIGPYLMDGVGLSPVMAGNLLLILNLGLILGSPVGGWLSDRVFGSRKGVVLVGLVGMASTVLALSQGWGTAYLWVLGGILFLLGASQTSGMVMYAHIKEVMPQGMTGMALTGTNFFTMLGAGLCVHGMGWIVEHWAAPGGGGYDAAFLAGFLGTGIALVLYLFTREPPNQRS